MADGKTLTWRKFPRDTITNPALLFIAKRMPKEKRHQVFTVITAMYCMADDGGVVDLSDLEVFADICMMETSELESLCYTFLEKNIIVPCIEDEALFKIVNWLDPYPTRSSGAERQAAYRSRQKEKKSFKGFSGKSGLQKPSLQKPEERQAENAPQDFYADFENMSLEEITRFLLSGEPVPGENPEAEESVTEYDGENNERNAQDNALHSENSRRYAVTPKTEEKREEKTDRKEQKRERTEQIDREEAEEKEIENRKEAEEREIETVEREGEQGEERKKEDRERRKREKREKEHTQKEREDRALQSGNGEDEKKAEQGQEIKQSREPPPEKIRNSFRVLWNFFEKYNPMGYAELEKEQIACTKLAIRMAKLENKKNSAEIIASQFANRFLKLLKTGGYYENMPFTPQMLLKSGNYSKVFSLVAKILHPQDAGGEHWAAELQKAMQNNKDCV